LLVAAVVVAPGLGNDETGLTFTDSAIADLDFAVHERFPFQTVQQSKI
jgi:uracil-DNA glycosylase